MADPAWQCDRVRVELKANLLFYECMYVYVCIKTTLTHVRIYCYCNLSSYFECNLWRCNDDDESLCTSFLLWQDTHLHIQ